MELCIILAAAGSHLSKPPLPQAPFQSDDLYIFILNVLLK